MTQINKEDLMIYILQTLKDCTKDFEISATRDLAHINLGELYTYEKIFNIIVATGELGQKTNEVDKEFKRIVEKARDILEKKLETLQI